MPKATQVDTRSPHAVPTQPPKQPQGEGVAWEGAEGHPGRLLSWKKSPRTGLRDQRSLSSWPVIIPGKKFPGILAKASTEPFVF